MSSPAEHIARLDRSIARNGETIRLQRSSTGPDGVLIPYEITCVAHVRASQPQDLVMPGEAPNSRVILSPTSLSRWDGLPRKDDRVFLQDQPASVEVVLPFYVQGTLVRIELSCRS